MQLQAKYVLPKIQMIINGMLSQTETSQIDFSHQEYSVQIKNRNHLTLNWYEPELTDLQWSLEFMGVKSLKHISVSHHQNKRIRILFWRVNSLHFFQGQLKDRPRIGSLRKSLLQSQKVIPIPLSNNDDVLYISEDLFPTEKKGVFFIETINKQFYVLIATQKKQELINLNHQNKISKLYSSVVGFWGSMVDENQAQNMVVSNSLVNELEDLQSFKAITLRDFELEIRFVNIPINPGDKCKFQTYQLYSVNLRNLIYNQLDLKSNTMLIRSEIYKINQAEIVVIFLIKNLTSFGYYIMVSVLIDYQKKQHKEVKKLQLSDQKLISVDFEKVHDIEELKHLIVKQQYQTQTILSKVTLRDLQVLQQIKDKHEGNSLLCSSENQDHLLLLQPYKVFQINFKPRQKSEQRSQSVMQQENINDKISSVTDVAKTISMNKVKIEDNYQSRNFDNVLLFFQPIKFQLNKHLISEQRIDDGQLKQLMKVWTALSLYESIVKFQSQTQKRFNDHRTFNDLNVKNNKNDFRQIFTIFNSLINHRKIDQFLSIWIDFLDFYKSREQFNNQKVRQVESSILNEQFSHLINKALEFGLIQRNNHQKIIEFINMSSGIIKIQRQNYRNLLNNDNGNSNNDSLKSIALQKVNFDLIQVIFFETGQIHKQELRQCFKVIKEQSQGNYENFVREFILEYVERMRQRKGANQEVRSFSNLLSIFPEQVGLMKNIYEQHEIDLDILLSLREGKRKEVAKKISKTAERMRRDDNKEKLLLTIQDLKDIAMKD